MAELSVIGFDADDTLWDHERYYQLTQARFVELLRDYADTTHLTEHLVAAERRNLLHYGFGVKGFTLSMIEAAIEVTEGNVPGRVLKHVLRAGRAMLNHPIEPLPGALETLAALAPGHKLVLITKGDLFDQERKLAASGLGDYFAAVEIVSDKSVATYERIFSRHGDGPARAMMVGNSLRSDVVPSLRAGAWGVHVPTEYIWAYDNDEEPADQPRFRRVQSLAALPALIDEIDSKRA